VDNIYKMMNLELASMGDKIIKIYQPRDNTHGHTGTDYGQDNTCV